MLVAAMNPCPCGFLTDPQSELIRQRVNNARMVQLLRFQKRSLHANAQMGARDIKRYCAVNDDGERLLETAINKLGLSARAYSRVLKVGRTECPAFPALSYLDHANTGSATGADMGIGCERLGRAAT